ncbi:MAG TPA: tetratricopeptide repeat protein [Bryobacteraceae bacterium]
MTVQSFLRGSFVLALSIGVFGQTPKPSTPGSGGSPTPTVPSRPGSTPTTMPGNQDGNQTLIQRPILLIGKVMMDDGMPPPDSVTVQLVCRTNPRSIAYTDSKGGFSADLSNRTNSAVMMDATESWSGSMANPMGSGSRSGSGSGFSERDLMGCVLQASLPGFRSDQVNLSSHKTLDNPDIGTIVLHRIGNVEGLTISATSRMAPKDAQKAFEKGRNEVKKQKWENGEKEFEKAVAVYPKYAAAWFELGLVQEERKDEEAARKSYAQALAADSKFVSPLLSLAAMSMRGQKWQEAADFTSRLLQLNPVDFPQAWYFNSVANYYLKKMDAAEKSAREGISRDTVHKYAKMNQVLGIVLAQKQDFTGAAEQLRAYLRYAPMAPDADQVKKQIADVEKFITPAEAASKQ